MPDQPLAEFGYDLFCVAALPPNGRFLELRGRWEELLGTSVDYLTTCSYLDLVHPEDMEWVAREFASLDVSDPTVTYDVRLLKADGNTLWTRWHGRFDADSGVFTAYGRDVSVEHRAVARLALLQDLIAASSAAATETEVVASAAQVICRRMGWAYAEAWSPLGFEVTAVSTYAHDPAYATFAVRSEGLRFPANLAFPGMALAQNRIIFTRDIGSDGRFNRSDWKEAQGLRGGVAVPVRRGPEVLGALVFLHTRPLGWDEELDDLLWSATEHLGAVAGRRLASHALRQREHDLQARVRELRGFVSTVTHDFRTPLKMLSLRLADLAASDAAQAVAAALDQERADADGLVNLLDHLLEFAWADQQEVVVEPINVAVLVGQVVRDHPEILGGAIRLLVDDLPSCEADGPLLRLALANLIGNAVKHASAVDDPTIRVSARRGDGYTEYVVSDNGPGFDPDGADRLFQVFERGLETEAPGLGLGLALVDRVMRRHGGRAWADSGPGQGARFGLVVPAAAGAVR